MSPLRAGALYLSILGPLPECTRCSRNVADREVDRDKHPNMYTPGSYTACPKKIQRLSTAGKHTYDGMTEGEMWKGLMEEVAF